jgi:hypothetical protein
VILPTLEIRAVAELARRDAWVCWRLARRNSRPTKPPFTPAGLPASVTDWRDWSSFGECWEAAFVQGRHRGIGRVLVAGEQLVAIDLDRAVAPDGTLSPWARSIVEGFPTYWEVSPSGRGLHAWARASWPTDGSKHSLVEIYTGRRFLTVTGRHLDGTPEQICAVELEPLQSFFPSLNGNIHESARGWRLASLCVSAPMPPPLVAELARTHPQLRRILERQYARQSERDLALVRFAHLAGWQPKAAWSLVAAVRRDEKAERADYAARTLARVYG